MGFESGQLVILNNEFMKSSQYLSQFQKEQYTQYLEGQLEKFSSFMLAQRKENDKYRQIEEVLTQNQKCMSKMKDQIELLEVYQHQNLQNCEHINKKMARLQDLEHRFQRLQDRNRSSTAYDSRVPSFNADSERSRQEPKDMEARLARQEKTSTDLTKKIKTIEDEIERNRELIIGICKSKSMGDQQECDLASHKDLKKLQKKMNRYFEQKFSQMEQILKKSQRKRSKSPSFKTPIDYVNSVSSAQQTQKILSQFRINDQASHKSEVSTLSRQTKHTPVESRVKDEGFKKVRKGKSKSKSRSKSRSKKADKQNKSKSKKSVSAHKSSLSLSKSPHGSCNESISKIYLKQKKDKSVTKSRRSSLSCDKREKSRGKNMVKRKSKKCPESCGSRYVMV